MTRVIMVPGLAVRRYLVPAAEALRAAGHEVDLVPPLGWKRSGSDLRRYARRVADRVRRDGPADLLIGFSVGTQAAVLAAAGEGVASRLLLISPTIDPDRRSRPAALATWLRGEHHRDSPRFAVQSQDWLRAGVSGINRGLLSAIDVRLEDELPRLSIPVTIVHGDADQISPLPFAADLATRSDHELLIMPDAPHSWPVGDGGRYCRLAGRLLSDGRCPVDLRPAG